MFVESLCHLTLASKILYMSHVRLQATSATAISVKTSTSADTETCVSSAATTSTEATTALVPPATTCRKTKSRVSTLMNVFSHTKTIAPVSSTLIKYHLTDSWFFDGFNKNVSRCVYDFDLINLNCFYLKIFIYFNTFKMLKRYQMQLLLFKSYAKVLLSFQFHLSSMGSKNKNKITEKIE